MSSTATPSSTTGITQSSIDSFHAHLSQSTRIVALLGAGLSASSGLPTFRGAGGLWRTHDATSLATPEAFGRDPAFVWQFYSYRRHMALNAKPNAAHYALAELSRQKPAFLTLSQNVDGLSPRAGHPAQQLQLLHGSLYDVKCFDQRGCGYIERNNFTDPIVPSLAIPQGGQDPTASAEQLEIDSSDQVATGTDTNPLIQGLDISDDKHALPSIPLHDLPRCPRCKHQLLRPGIVWFGEALPSQTLAEIDTFIKKPGTTIDLMLVIGTSSAVWPAAGYTEIARNRGARVAVINMDPESGRGLEADDWFFCGDAAEIVPELLRPVIGDVDEIMGQYEE
ncbi:hypothetical protein LTR66_017756 [Elasticomyces elasticus]|nr:hypothetical protein LTR66_017756 [Elasticomyces elasticus]